MPVGSGFFQNLFFIADLRNFEKPNFRNMNFTIKKFFREGIKWNIVFLGSVIITVFIIPVFPPTLHRMLYDLSLTMIFLLGFLNSEKRHPAFLPVSVVTVVLLWVSAYLELPVLFTLSYSLNIMFFGIVIIGLIKHLINSKTVTIKIILEAIIIYLLIGLIFAMVISLMDHFDPRAFSFQGRDLSGNGDRLNDFIYFTFVTLSTTGYGDIIPLQPYARSLTIFMAITGQMYMAIIIAMLVGKYAASRQDDKNEE